MLISRRAIVVSLFATSLIYAWSRYHKRKKAELELASHLQAITFMGITSLLCCGTYLFRKRQKPSKKSGAPYAVLKNIDEGKLSATYNEGQSVKKEESHILQTNSENKSNIESQPIHSQNDRKPIQEDVILPQETRAFCVPDICEDIISDKSTLQYKSGKIETSVHTGVPVVNLERQSAGNIVAEAAVSISVDPLCVNIQEPDLEVDSEKLSQIVSCFDTKKTKVPGPAEIKDLVEEALPKPDEIAVNPHRKSIELGAFNNKPGILLKGEKKRPDLVTLGKARITTQTLSTSKSRKNKNAKQKGMPGSSVIDEAMELFEKNISPSGSDNTQNSDAGNLQCFPKGLFNDPDYDIVEDSPEVIDGKAVPRVLVPSELWAEAVEKDTWRETYYVPAGMGGVLIGRFGKNVRELKSQWNAEFSLNMCPGRQDTLLLKLSCPLEHKDCVMHWINSRFKMRPSQTTIGNPNQLKRNLRMGECTEVQVRSLYGLKEFFLTIKDVEYQRYLKMQEELDKDYSTLSSSRMQLYEPVTSGTVAILPHYNGFARALILKVLLTWPREALCFLLDHGSFGVASLINLRKIKAKYMRVPFQAIHATWAHAMPIYSDVPDLHILRTLFSYGRIVAFPVRMETCCRPSVALLEFQQKEASRYSDILSLACRCGLYVTTPVGIFPNRQSWLNRSTTPYYPCPYSDIPYKQLVEYFLEDTLPSNQHKLTATNQAKRALPDSRNLRRSQQSQCDNYKSFRKNSRKNNGRHPKKGEEAHV